MTTDTTTAAPTSVSPLTIEEMGESLTGFEEIAIVSHFNGTLSSLLSQNPTMGLRALIFTNVHRLGETNVQESKKRAMDLPLREVMAYFREEDDSDLELDPDAPETDSGKPDALDG